MKQAKVISWDQGLQILRELLPNCKEFVPDSIATSASDLGMVVDFVPFHEWESLSDTEIFQRLLPEPLDPSEELLVVNDASFSKNSGPYKLLGSELEEFVTSHLNVYGECAVTGDVIVLLPAARLVVLLHHEGFYCRISCKQAGSIS